MSSVTLGVVVGVRAVGARAMGARGRRAVGAAATAAGTAAALVLALSACTGSSGTSESSAPGRPGSAGTETGGTAAPADIVTALEAPWSVVRFDGGIALVSERDSGRILELSPGAQPREVGVIDAVAHSGEGGLLGIAVRASADNGDARELFAYFTTERDNRVVRMPLLGDPGALRLGGAKVVIEGIPKAGIHNGGRIAFGPDGTLFVTCGDAGDTARAQDRRSLGGKILRLEPDGSIPGDNPFAGSPVYSMGHRNPQGLAWDSDGQLWASEFGQNTWDELNRIEAGKNYGWPVVEGKGGKGGGGGGGGSGDGDGEGEGGGEVGDGEGGSGEYVDPVLQWRTSEASPSGIAIVDDTIYMAALRGARLWAIRGAAGEADTSNASATPYFVNEFGRLRDVVAVDGNSLWIVTNNTDGRGSPRDGDDRIIQVSAPS